MKKTVQDIAEFLGGTVIGNGEKEIVDIKGLAEAGADDVTFAVDPYTEFLPKVHAGAVIVAKEVPCGDNTLILVENPRLAFSKLLVLFHPRQTIPDGVHETAIIANSATLGENASVMAYAVIGKNVKIGKNCTIYPYVFIGDNVTIGDDCVIYPGAVIHENCELGNRLVVRAHAVIGGEGFGFATKKDGKHTRIPQIGNVKIEDDVEIGACTCIDNGTLDSTVIKRGTKVDNLVHLGHNVQVGEDCFLIAQVGVAGSTKIGNHCVLAGQVGCAGHLDIGENSVFAGKTGITGNVKPGSVMAGYPMQPHMEWKRTQVYMKHLPDMAKKLKALEKKIAQLEELTKQ